MRNVDSNTTAGRYFAGLTENVFHGRLGITDPALVDYLSVLLLRFIRTDVLHRVRTANGRPALEVAEMLVEAEQRVGLAKRDVHQHIGDVTLFWVGLYPEAMEQLRGVERRDYFVDYCSQGKRAYFIASTITTDRADDPTGDVLGQLSAQFEMCAYGLGEVRREWERGDDDPSGRALWVK